MRSRHQIAHGVGLEALDHVNPRERRDARPDGTDALGVERRRVAVEFERGDDREPNRRRAACGERFEGVEEELAALAEELYADEEEFEGVA